MPSANRIADDLTWRLDLTPADWDQHLAELRGHPLQSALWGTAREAVDGIASHQWAAFLDERPVFMARFEERPIRPVGKLAWIPKGPTSVDDAIGAAAFTELLGRLRRSGFVVCVDDVYRQPVRPLRQGVPLLPNLPTAWIDLRVGREKLLTAIDSKTRYGIRAAEKAKVVVEETRNAADVSDFFGLCEKISKDKNFSLRGSEPLMQALCAAPASAQTEAKLFVARVDGRLAAGAMILRCGRSIHYFWAAMDRSFVKQHPSEAIQWAVIQWGVESSLDTYDLEGIDPMNNPGTTQFKMKLGAKEMALPGRRAYPLGIIGRLVLRVGLSLRRI